MYVYLLCLVLDRAPAEIDLAGCWPFPFDPRIGWRGDIILPSVTQPTQVAQSQPSAVTEDQDPVLRRQLLFAAAGLLIDPDLLTSLHLQRALDAPTLDYLDLLAERYASDLWATPTRSLTTMVRGHYWQLSTLLSNSQPSSSHRRRLTAQSARMALLLGRLARHSDNRGDALAYWNTAQHLAIDAGDRALQATVLVDRSHYLDDRHTVAGLDGAARLIDPDLHPYLHAWLLTRRARALATIGCSLEAQDDIDRARTTLSNASVQPTGYFAGWNTHWLSSYQADCAIRLQQYREAADLLESLLRTSSPAPYHRLALLADLAVAYAHEGEIQHSCTILSEALTIATALQTPQQLQHIHGVRHTHFAGWQDEPAVRHLDEQLHAATYGASSS